MTLSRRSVLGFIAAAPVTAPIIAKEMLTKAPAVCGIEFNIESAVGGLRLIDVSHLNDVTRYCLMIEGDLIIDGSVP